MPYNGQSIYWISMTFASFEGSKPLSNDSKNTSYSNKLFFFDNILVSLIVWVPDAPNLLSTDDKFFERVLAAWPWPCFRFGSNPIIQNIRHGVLRIQKILVQSTRMKICPQ